MTFRSRIYATSRGSSIDAIVASIYYAALLMPSPGDAIERRSARQWLGAIGIKV